LALHRNQKGREIKVWNYLRHSFVCAIQVIPNPINPPQRKPMIRRITNKPFFLHKVLIRFNRVYADHLQIECLKRLYINPNLHCKTWIE
jgi:hypothetical protein